MTQYLALAWAKQAVLGPAKLLLWESASGRSASRWVPWSACPSLILQMSKAAGWDYYLGAAVMNSACQGLELVLTKLPSSPSLSGFQYWALHIPLPFVWWEIRVGAPMKWPTMLREAGCPSWAPSLWRNQRLCVVLCCSGEVQLMCSCFSYSSNLACLGLWGIGGVSASPLCSRIPSVLSCTCIDISSSCEEEQSEEWPMSPSWWHHSKSSFLNSQHFLLYFLVLIFKKALFQPALVTYVR